MADQLLADTLAFIAATWPDIKIDPDRIAGWEKDIEGGTRSPEDLKADILEYVVGKDKVAEWVAAAFEERGLSADNARLERLTKEIMEGRAFSDVDTNLDEFATRGGDTADGDLATEKGARGEEDKTEEGIGGDTTILTSSDMQWYFDPDRGKWYVSYGLPNSDRRILYEATGSQMDAIFGEGMRPSNYDDTQTFEEITQAEGVVYGGSIVEMHGTGSFEGHVQDTIARGLDEGILPEWAKNDPAVMDIIFLANAEEKSYEWMLDEIYKLDSFKKRFPGIDNLEAVGLTTTEAVTAFLEMESGIKQLVARDGGNPDTVTPEQVGELLAQGHSLNDVQFTFDIFDQMERNSGALDAFNDILEARGLDPLDADGMFDLMAGNAPKELYDIWEESSLHRAAMDAGLDLGVQGAVDMAARTEGLTSYDAAYEGLSLAAKNLLRFRTQINLGQYGLDEQDLIDMAMGVAPASGTSQADIARNMERAVRSAQAQVENARVNPFRNFSDEGVPKAASLGRSKQESA